MKPTASDQIITIIYSYYKYMYGHGEPKDQLCECTTKLAIIANSC